MHNRFFFLTVAITACLTSSAALAEVVRMEVTEQRLFAEGRAFGATGPYEVVRGRFHMEVNPAEAANLQINDLHLAPRNARGRVEFWTDFFLLRPADPLRGNRRLLYDVDNRGNKLALWTFNEAEAVNDPSTFEHAGNGFLMREGYSVLWCGWNGDVMDDGENRMRAGLPVARQENGEPITGRILLELMVDKPERSVTFGWSPWGIADAYPPVDPEDPGATMTRRPSRAHPGIEVPRDQWGFGRWEEDRIVPHSTSVYLEGGFEPGWLYDVVYTAADPRVTGLGLASVRDTVSFLRYAETDETSAQNPLAGAIDHAYMFGISQSGRVVTHMIYDGFHVDVAGRPVFDGAIAHVAGAGRGLFNQRFGLSTLYSAQHTGNLVPIESFPMATVPNQDPLTGEEGDVLARAREQGHVPKIFYVQSSTEYWSRGASLLHTDVQGERDLDVDPNVRIYLIAGSQHLGATPATRTTGQTPRNPLVHRTPVLRALLVALDQWVGEGLEPPASQYPRIDDGTLVSVETFNDAFPSIPGVRVPEVLYRPLRLDLGSRWRDEGIADTVPPKVGPAYGTLVPMVDGDGNELAGIRLPDIAVPLGTYTGWSLRSKEHGAEDMLTPLDGSYIEFAHTAEERRRSGDPRPAIPERFPTRDVYLSEITEQAMKLHEERYLLGDDAIRLIRQAAQRDLWGDEE